MKKTVTILLAIFMLLAVCPMVFAADAAPDFSDAKVLTSVDGDLYIDGVAAESNSSGNTNFLPTGKYKLTGDITLDVVVYIIQEQNVVLDLNGYNFNFSSYWILVDGTLSVYDTSSAQTGKMVSPNAVIQTNHKDSILNLYSGTIESTDWNAISSTWGETYLYGGKAKGATNAVAVPGDTQGIKLCETLLESGEDYPQVFFSLSMYITETDIIPVDVSEYSGKSLSVEVYVLNTTGNIRVLEGIKNAQDAERYTVNMAIDESCAKKYGIFHKETVYNEETGEICVVIDKFAFTQQPTAENNYTADTNNAKASYQWYETVAENSTAFVSGRNETVLSGDFKAGDVVTISTEDDITRVRIRTPDPTLSLDSSNKSATYIFDADQTFVFTTMSVNATETPVNLNITVMRYTILEGETGKTLSDGECGKTYVCMATLNGYSAFSDVVTYHPFTDDGDCTTPVLCTNCGETVIEAKEAHNQNGTVAHKDATCTEDGVVGGTYCDACDNGKAEAEAVIPAQGHGTTEIVGEKEATATEDGYTGDTYCTVCDNKIADGKVIPATGTPDEPAEECDHLCHSDHFLVRIFWKIIGFFQRLLGIQQYCDCGELHYDKPVFAF